MQSAVAFVNELPQHLAALENANTVRLRRAAIKRELKAGERDFRTIFEEPACISWGLLDAVIALNRWGVTRARRLLAQVPASEMITVGALTDRQRAEVCRLLGV
jgi:hypothetical protein